MLRCNLKTTHWDRFLVAGGQWRQRGIWHWNDSEAADSTWIQSPSDHIFCFFPVDLENLQCIILGYYSTLREQHTHVFYLIWPLYKIWPRTLGTDPLMWATRGPSPLTLCPKCPACLFSVSSHHILLTSLFLWSQTAKIWIHSVTLTFHSALKHTCWQTNQFTTCRKR